MKRVHAVIRDHFRGDDDGEATLARLVEQHLRLRVIEPLICALGAGAVTIREEDWSIERLAGLWLAHHRANPTRHEGPLVVARVNGVEMLIDGNNRCGKLLADGDAGKWPVLVIEV